MPGNGNSQRSDLQGSWWRFWEDNYGEGLQGVLSWPEFRRIVLEQNPHLQGRTDGIFELGVQYTVPAPEPPRAAAATESDPAPTPVAPPGSAAAPEAPTIPGGPAPRELARGHKGQDVQQLQLLLAGFAGTVWDGDFGPGTERQVKAFQRDFMNHADPSGVVDAQTRGMLRQFLGDFGVERAALVCPCGECQGFGQGRGKGVYRDGGQEEAYHQYEYPGIHLAVLQAFRAARFYAARAVEEGALRAASADALRLTSGYRCASRNEQQGRTSTNHMGKALDSDLELPPGSDKQDDVEQSEKLRELLVARSGCQIGWTTRNVKALEPGHIAPTWVHVDVRCYERRYLDDSFFTTTPEDVTPCFAALLG